MPYPELKDDIDVFDFRKFTLLILEILVLEFDYVSLKSHKIDKIIIKDTPSLSSIIQCKLVYYITIIDMKLTN